MLAVYLAIFIPFLAAIFIPLIHRMFRLHIGWFVLAIPISLFSLLASQIPFVSKGNTFHHALQWIPSFNINLITYMDGLSLLFALLITGIGSLVILYSIYYLSTEESLRHFYIYLLLFMGSMLGLVFSDHLIILYTFWELTSISSFLLIAFWYHRKGSRYGAKKALMITVTGGMAMLSGFLILYFMTGTFSIREIISMSSQIKDHILFIPAMLCILFGAFAKSAQFPFHIWLPDAMEAPTPVSAYLHSATMVKAGIFLVARFTPLFGGDQVWFWTVTCIGLITLFWGSFTAIRQTDLKALLAYSTVSQLGLIMSLLGVGSIAFHPSKMMETMIFSQAAFAALFHLFNHATFKGALFMIIGILDFRVGTRDIRRLGGLMAVMPVSFTIALIGSASMAGLPPFNGFLSKEMFLDAFYQLSSLHIFSIDSVGFLLPFIAWFASVFTFIYSMIIVLQTFLGPSQQKKLETEVKEASFGMLVSPIIMASLVIGIFFYPNIVGNFLLKPAMSSILVSKELVDIAVQPIYAWHGFTPPLIMTIGIIVAGALLYFTFPYWRLIFRLFPTKWSFDALYNALTNRAEHQARLMTNFYMTGYLRDYLLYIFFFFAIVISFFTIKLNAVQFHVVKDTPIHVFEWMIIVIIAIAALIITLSTSRLHSILLTGFIGFLVALMFVIFKAPDLALTQLVVETVTTALFLLCFYFLPTWERKETKRIIHVGHALIAITVGVIFTIIALIVHQGPLFDTVSDYYEQAEQLAGAKNIVNTILGDFRAFDTMLEVIVLFIAGIGVFSVIKLKRNVGASRHEDQ